MKRLKYYVVDVPISERQVTRVTEPAWVLPILVALHTGTAGEPEVVEEVLIEREPPVAAAEYERLCKRYRCVLNPDGSKGIPYAAAVYGAMSIGVAAMAKAIDEATVEFAEDGVSIPKTGIGDLLGEGVQNSSVGG